MNKRTICILSLMLLVSLMFAAGCGSGQGLKSSNAPSAEEIGAPVYPGASFEGTGYVKGSYKFTTGDSSREVVDWYRKELAGKQGLTETNKFKEAVTGDAITYKEGGKTIWITVLPGLDPLPTKIDIEVSTDFGTTPGNE